MTHSNEGSQADRRSARAEAQRGRRREAILEAAATLFAQRGYHAASISDVIDAAGISRGTFYLYFDSKDAIFLELMERFIQHVTDAVEVVDPHGVAPTRKIAENVSRVVDVVFDNRDLATMVLREDLGLKPEVDEKLERMYGFLRAMVEGALVNGAKKGLTRKVNEPVVATALIGAIKEVILRHLVERAGRPPEREAVAESLLDFGLNGLLMSPKDRLG
jgi:AcrR family transcriptional regulator